MEYALLAMLLAVVAVAGSKALGAAFAERIDRQSGTVTVTVTAPN